MWRTRVLCSVAATLLVGPSVKADSANGDETFFETKIRPVLAETCFQCHGGKKVGGDLRVDSREALVRGGGEGPAIVPGQSDASVLIQAIRYQHDSVRMPPGRRLPDAVVADFARWVDAGAPWPKATPAAKRSFVAQAHWAFEPVKPASPPDDPTGWSQHPIDRFIAARRSAHDLEPVGAAEKRTLLRRITFDLVGLPPTPDELAGFLADESPAAYEHVVDRLLASPHYGERWGRHWMDVIRYADTAGDNADYPVPEARLYRDYIIDAFNADKPYDAFVREQLAGDIIAAQGPRELYAERVIATGFLALSRRYGTAPEELWHLTLEDTIETTGRAFLGLTLRCARCHDHKFDPVTNKDYYALYGIFASTKFPYAGSEEFQSKKFPRANFAPLVPPQEAAARWATYRTTLESASVDEDLERDRRRLKERTVEWDRAIHSLSQSIASLESNGQPTGPLKDQKARLERSKADAKAASEANADKERQKSAARKWGLPADLPGAYAVHESTPVAESVHLRGEPSSRGAVVARNVPAFLAGPNPPRMPEGSSGRLELARWLTAPEHPLTARVMVNRVWHHHFGRGVVGSPSNFGVRGDEPTHPELLDWLTSQFVSNGWSIKALHRLIVTSKTYQMASVADPGALAKDPENRSYWRFDRRRLDAEAIRDAMLAVSGRLDLRTAGEHPFPPISEWRWTQHSPFKAVYPTDRRSVYLMTQRLQRHPYLALFDGPDTNHSTDRRTSANVPLQALYLMNNPFVQDQARALAGRLIAESNDVERRLNLATTLAWGRPPRPAEADAYRLYLRDFARESAASGRPDPEADVDAWASLAKVLLTANEFLYLD